MKIERILKCIDKSIWKDSVNNAEVISIVSEYLSKLDMQFSKQKMLHRIVGQSGSGKTTQISSSLNESFRDSDIKPVVLAVRKFAAFHPNYNFLLNTYGSSLIREKTNGFALKCLCVALNLLMKQGYYIVLEVTFLDLWFEKFVKNLAQLYGYNVVFHCLAVNKTISNKFIQKRFCSSGGKESGRVTLKSSSNYFYKKLKPAFKYNKTCFKNSRAVMWNAYDYKPFFVGDISHGVKLFFNHQKNKKESFTDENLLKQSKINFYKNNPSLF